MANLNIQEAMEKQKAAQEAAMAAAQEQARIEAEKALTEYQTNKENLEKQRAAIPRESYQSGVEIRKDTIGKFVSMGPGASKGRLVFEDQTFPIYSSRYTEEGQKQYDDLTRQLTELETQHQTKYKADSLYASFSDSTATAKNVSSAQTELEELKRRKAAIESQPYPTPQGKSDTNRRRAQEQVERRFYELGEIDRKISETESYIKNASVTPLVLESKPFEPTRYSNPGAAIGYNSATGRVELGAGDARGFISSTSKTEDQARLAQIAKEAGYTKGATIDPRIAVFKTVDTGIMTPGFKAQPYKDVIQPQQQRKQTLTNQPDSKYANPNFVSMEQQQKIDQLKQSTTPKQQSNPERYTLTFKDGKKLDGLTKEQVAAYQDTFALENKLVKMKQDKQRQNVLDWISEQKNQGYTLVDIRKNGKKETVPIDSAFGRIMTGGEAVISYQDPKLKQQRMSYVEARREQKKWVKDVMASGAGFVSIKTASGTQVIPVEKAWDAIRKAPLDAQISTKLPVDKTARAVDDKQTREIIQYEQGRREISQDPLSQFTYQQEKEAEKETNPLLGFAKEFGSVAASRAGGIVNFAENIDVGITRSIGANVFKTQESKLSKFPTPDKQFYTAPIGGDVVIGATIEGVTKVSSPAQLFGFVGGKITEFAKGKNPAQLTAQGAFSFAEIVAPTKSPIKLNKYVQEVVPASAPKGATFTLTAIKQDGKGITKTFKNYDEAIQYQQQMEIGLSKKGTTIKSSTITATESPIKQVEIMGRPIITKVEEKTTLGSKGLDDVPRLTKVFERMSPTGRGTEIPTLTPMSRKIFTSEAGGKAAVDAGVFTERDIEAIKIGQETIKIVEKEEAKLKPQIKNTFSGITSLKGEAEQSALYNQILPMLQKVKGNFAQVMQVRPSLLKGTGREVTGDIDSDYRLWEKARKIGLGKLSEKVSQRKAQKDITKSQEILTDVAAEGREFEARGTKLYAKEGDSEEKVLELLTKKDEATAATDSISDYSSVYGRKYSGKSVKLETGAKLSAIEDQLATKFASAQSIQGPRTEKFAGEGRPDYLKEGMEIQTTKRGFGVMAPEARLKDVVDIPILMKEIGFRLKESGRTKSGNKMIRLAERYQTLYPEIDFGKAYQKVTFSGERDIPSRSISSKIEPVTERLPIGVTGIGLDKKEKEQLSVRSPYKSAIVGTPVKSIISKSSTRSKISESKIMSDVSMISSITRSSRPAQSARPSQRSKTPSTKSSVSRLIGKSQISPTRYSTKSPTKSPTASPTRGPSPIVTSPIRTSPIKTEPIKIKVLPPLQPIKPITARIIPQKTRTDKGKPMPQNPREDFFGSSHAADIMGFRKTKSGGEFDFGDEKTAKLVAKDISETTTGRPRFISGKKKNIIPKSKSGVIRAWDKKSRGKFW